MAESPTRSAGSSWRSPVFNYIQDQSRSPANGDGSQTASKDSFIVVLLWVLPHNYLNSANAHETSEACISHKEQSLNQAGGCSDVQLQTHWSDIIILMKII